jgi:Tfp pilus assembly protein FimV
MSSKRLNRLLLATIALLIVALGGGVYAVNGVLGQRADKVTKLKAKSQALDQEQVQLTKAKQEIKQYAGLYKTAQAVVPEDKNQAEVVREIVNVASANNIKLASISFPASTLGSSPAGVTGTQAAPSAVPAPNPNSPASKLSQLQPVKNIPGVYLLQIVVTSDTSQPVQYDRFISFLQALEHNRRTAQVSTITLQPSVENHNYLSFALTLNGYIKP